MGKTYDVIVLGAGPAGMMSAISASQQKGKTLLIEHGKKSGRKLLLTGGTRCNLTNNQDIEKIISNIPGNGKFLYSALNQFSPQDIMDFFEKNGLPLKEEDLGRIFPESNSAKSVLATLEKCLNQEHVEVLHQVQVKKILTENNQVIGVATAQGEFLSSQVILATGGKSYPQTGSNGSGYKLVNSLGHKITPLSAAEAPIYLTNPFIKDRTLQGLSLQNVTLKVLKPNGKSSTEHTGDLLFTHFGISGPIALRCSTFVKKQLEKLGNATLALDLFPQKSQLELKTLLETKLQHSTKKLSNLWHGLLPEKLLLFFLEQLNLLNTTASETRKQDLLDFCQLAKNWLLTANDIFPVEKAFVTKGGISLKEVNPKTMESKLISGLFFAGEVLDINGYTGGYNLTAAFSTGFVAGKHAGEKSSSF